ncbi:hypothetical protein TNIN_402111 [Trichonephila inaurata madagascariensis]|uniref:Uncharacterized protein n=1 Tax=Trichonephila inaurata madagascariensis TaxID=2747483 RepID=A0A8X6WPM6_9ARAC|nr:hypothetical protein TNIN_402111 [Trichonephila inaurata madagascariensis]
MHCSQSFFQICIQGFMRLLSELFRIVKLGISGFPLFLRTALIAPILAGIHAFLYALWSGQQPGTGSRDGKPKDLPSERCLVLVLAIENVKK